MERIGWREVDFAACDGLEYEAGCLRDKERCLDTTAGFYMHNSADSAASGAIRPALLWWTEQPLPGFYLKTGL